MYSQFFPNFFFLAIQLMCENIEQICVGKYFKQNSVLTIQNFDNSKYFITEICS